MIKSCDALNIRASMMEEPENWRFQMKSNLLALAVLGLSLTAQTARAESSRLDDMISPVSNPVNFEDPRHSTELRPIFAYHNIQDDFVTGGGAVQVYALQARFKLTDDLSLIATKDGFVHLDPDGVLPENTGFANLAAGLKYSVLRSDTYIVTAGLRYEIPWGEEDVLQGSGNGAINPFVTAALAVDNFNFMAATGLRQRFTSRDSSFWDVDLHADYKIGNFYPLVEANLVHPYNSGERLPIADEGADFFNLGSSFAAGENILTMAAGARYRICENVDIGAAYQFPLDRGEGTGIFDWRITADAIVRFSI